MNTPIKKVSVQHALSTISEAWMPHRLGTINDTEIKIARLDGDFVWHSHPDTDELFYVLEGQMALDLADQTLHLGPGELIVVPRGVRHCPRAPGGCVVLLVEARDTINTGDAAPGALTRDTIPDRSG